MYVFDKFNNASYYNLRLNPDQSATQSIAAIESIYKKNFPDLPFEYQFVDEEYAAKFASEERVGSLAGVFTGLAILISLFGSLRLSLLHGRAAHQGNRRSQSTGRERGEFVAVVVQRFRVAGTYCPA